MQIHLHMLNTLAIPRLIRLVAKYMEYVDGETEYVMQRHSIGKSQHIDFRIRVDPDYLVGWTITGFSEDDPATVEKLIENIGKGFRAEEKCENPFCNDWRLVLIETDSGYRVEYSTRNPDETILARQPVVWLMPKLKIGDKVEIPPREIGAGEEAPGSFTVIDRGKAITGTQKPVFHEYFLKDDRYFKDWTRVVVRGVEVPVIDPKTKTPIPGRKEYMWRFMIPRDQMPYAISKRAIEEKKWKPPLKVDRKTKPPDTDDFEELERWVLENYYIPFPLEWTKEHYPKQYQRWILYMTGRLKELSKIRYSLLLVSWMGARAKTGRQMPKFNWYLLLDTEGKGKVRTFKLEGYPLRDDAMPAWDFGRVSRRWLDYAGKIQPQTIFNPNKRLVADCTLVDSGSLDYDMDTTEDGREIHSLKIPRGHMKGVWIIEQEEKGSDIYLMRKVEDLEIQLEEYKFVLDHHEFPANSGRWHYDIRIQVDDHIEEFNLYGDPIESSTPIKAVYKKCYDLWWVNVKDTPAIRKVAGVESTVLTIDHGTVTIIERNPNFMSFQFKGDRLKGFYVARRVNRLWEFSRGKTVEIEESKREGDPRSGIPFKPYVIEDRRGWSFFIVYLYDIRAFTRVEPFSRASEYLGIEIPEGVDVGIGLYPVPGEIHNARVAYVRFSKDKWDYDSAVEWIDRNKLSEFHSKMKRKEKRSE